MTLERGTGLELQQFAQAPTLAINSVTTGAPGSEATVVNVGSQQDALLDITIPAGATGAQGVQGTAGTNGTNGTNGANGQTPTLVIGTVTTLSSGTSATANVRLVSGVQYAVDLGIPMGPAGSGSSVAWGGITGGDPTVQTDLKALLDAKAPLASPSLTGNPTAPTPTAGDNDTSIATTAFVQSAISGKAPINSPIFTGNPTAPTPTAGDNDTSLATTAFVQTALAPYAPKDSPTLTGTAAAPTATAGDNSTKIATTAFVRNELTNYAKLDGPLLINDPKADGNLIGYRNLPTSRTISTTGQTLADSDKGKKIVWTGATGTITLNPNATTAIDADAIGTIVNNGTGVLTIARGAGVSAKLMGSGADANRSIAVGGVATWMKVGTNAFFIGGPGVS